MRERVAVMVSIFKYDAVDFYIDENKIDKMSQAKYNQAKVAKEGFS